MLLAIVIVARMYSDGTVHENNIVKNDDSARGSELFADDGKEYAKAKFEKFMDRLYKIEPNKNLYDLDEELRVFFTKDSDDKNMINLPVGGETAYDWFSSDYRTKRIVAERNERGGVTIIAFLKLSETNQLEVYDTNTVICADMTEEDGEWLIEAIPLIASFKTFLPYDEKDGVGAVAHLNSDNETDLAKTRLEQFLRRCYQIDKGTNLVDVDKELLRFFSSDAYNKIPFVTGHNPYSIDAPSSEYGDFSFEYEIVRLAAEKNANGCVTAAAVLNVTKTETIISDITVVICVDMRLENGEWLICDIPIHGEYGEYGGVQI
jgi:hypothetical protein